MRTMDLADLDIFRCVAREGGVVRAAACLNRVPSNVTTRIKQFEDRLGVKLFGRRGRGLVLTDAGRTLLVHAERILQMAACAEQEVRSGTVRGTLRLGSLESAAGARLPPLLAAFHAAHPDVAIELRTGTTGSLLRMLHGFEIEAALVSEPFEPAGLESQPVFDERLVLIAARGHALPQDAAQWRRTTVLAFPHGCSYRRRLLEWIAEAGASPGRLHDLGSYHAIVACVAAGAGVAIVPAEVLDQVVLGAAVQRHALPSRLRTNRTHLVWNGEPSPPLRAFMDALPRPRHPGSTRSTRGEDDGARRRR